MPEEEYRESDDSEDDYDNKIVWNNYHSNNDNMAGYDDDSSENDDDVVEEISNAAAKAEVLAERINEARAIKQQKDKVKEKRRKVCIENEKRNLAKKLRLDNIASRRLNEESLETVKEVSGNHKLSDTKPKKSKFSTDVVIDIPSSSTHFEVKTLKSGENSVVARSEQLKLLKEKLLLGSSKRRESAKKAFGKIGKQKAAGLG
ncbi:hypothetical protein CHUAL_000688 [Chamberlinius hualienensis]